MKQLYRILTLVGLTAIAVGCKSDYNFDNISLEVTVGDTNGIVIPVGEIEPVTLASIMEESGLETDSDGYYGFDFSGGYEYSASFGTIDPIKGLIPAISPITTEILGALDTSLPSFHESRSLAFPEGIEGNMTIPEGFPLIGSELPIHYDVDTFESTFEITLPREVAAMKQITFGQDGNGSLVEFTFDLGGIADVSSDRLLEKFIISLPSGFELGKVENDPLGDTTTISSSEGSTTNNTFTITNYQMEDSSITVDFLIKSINLEDHEIEDGKMILNANIDYHLDFTSKIKAGTASAVAPSVAIASDLTFHSATIVTGHIAHPFSFSQEISQEFEVPAEIQAVHAVNFAGEPHLTVSLSIDNSPVSSLQLHKVTIQLPHYISVEAPQGWQLSGSTLYAEEMEIAADGKTHTFIDLPIRGLSQLALENGKVDLSSSIYIGAEAYLAQGEELTIGGQKEDITITPKITLDELSIESVSGIIRPDLSAYLEPIEVDLSDFTSSLEGLEMDLNIASPLLRIAVENPIGVGIEANAYIRAYKGEELVGFIATPTLQINPATTQSVTTDILIIDSSAEGQISNENGTVYTIEGLVELIGTLPDRITVTFDAYTDDGPHTLYLKDSYTFKVDYSVDAALCFDEQRDGEIHYTTTIDDIDLSSLADIDLTIESLAAKVATTSTLPIDLTLNIELLDENDTPISCVASSTEGVIAGTTTSEPKESECTILLDIAYPTAAESTPSPFAEIARTKKIRCTLHGVTLAGGGLRPEQSLSARLSLLLPEGITIDLESLLPDSEEEPDEEATE